MKILIKLFSILIFSLSLLVFVGNLTSAQATSSEDIAKKYGITFPVSDLGNCADLNACKTYCQDPANKTQCIEFAKKKGFYKESAASGQEILKKANDELGCDSVKACKNLCANDTNLEKCNKFAAKYNLVGGLTRNPSDSQILQKAKDALGCDSYKSCFIFCTQEANRQKCSEFAKKVNLQGGVENKGPGRCDSPQSCQSFCREHPHICSKFKEHSNTQTNLQAHPEVGNCQTLKGCYEWCKANPGKCPGFNPNNQPPKNPNEPTSGSKLQNYFPFPPNSTPQAETGSEPPASPSVHGARTGPSDWVSQTLDSVVNFITSIF